MTNLLHSPPTVGAQSLRTLGRFPSRTAFSWPGGSITYGGAIHQMAACRGSCSTPARVRPRAWPS